MQHIPQVDALGQDLNTSGMMKMTGRYLSIGTRQHVGHNRKADTQFEPVTAAHVLEQIQ